MKKLTYILGLKSDDELFEYITTNFKTKGILQWDYFVNWEKVHLQLKSIEVELNLLNVLIGKEDIETELYNLLIKYPQIAKTFPFLLAYRGTSVDILDDAVNFVYLHYDFNNTLLSEADCNNLVKFFMNSGLGSLIQRKEIKNLVDYVSGVEVGLDSNGRKNRGGTQMENIVEIYIKKVCKELDLPYLKEANAKKIKEEWGIEIAVDKSSRRIDYVINKDGQLYFFEVNFYGGGGSKLKSTATEYVKMNEYWNAQGIEFVWITDGAGWSSTLKPLREYFDKADYLLNLEMLRESILIKIFE
jgi:type II restriction enzyme